MNQFRIGSATSQEEKIDKQLVYDGKYMSTKLKSYNGKIKTDFHS